MKHKLEVAPVKDIPYLVQWLVMDQANQLLKLKMAKAGRYRASVQKQLLPQQISPAVHHGILAHQTDTLLSSHSLAR